MFGAEIANEIAVRGDQCRRHQRTELVHEQLLGRVAHLHRIVDHQGFGVDLLEQMSRRDVGHVERRVLPHEHHVHDGQVEHLRRTQGEVVSLLAAHLERPRARRDPAVGEGQIVGQVVVEAVAAPLRLEGQDERAVGVDVDPFDGIHLDGDGETHLCPSNAGARPRPLDAVAPEPVPDHVVGASFRRT